MGRSCDSNKSSCPSGHYSSLLSPSHTFLHSVVIRSMHEACVSDLCALKIFPKKTMFMKADEENEPEDKRRE